MRTFKSMLVRVDDHQGRRYMESLGDVGVGVMDRPVNAAGIPTGEHAWQGNNSLTVPWTRRPK